MRILKPASNIFALILCYHFSSCGTSPEEYQPEYQLKTLWEKVYFSVTGFDFDNDGIDELFVDHGEQINISDTKGGHIFTSFVKIDSRYLQAIPISTGRLDSLELLIQHSNAEEISFDRWQIGRAFEKEIGHKDFLKFTGKDVDGNGIANLNIRFVGKLKVSERKQAALFILDSDKDAVKRGLMALDMQSGTILWEFLCGPQVQNIIVKDLDQDSKPEILLGTYAPDNGAEFNGIRDDSSYVFLLNSEGTLRWKKSIGGIFTGGHIEAGDMTGDGRFEIIVYRYSVQQPEEIQDEVMLLDMDDGTILKDRKIGEWFTSEGRKELRFLTDLDGDGLEELVVGNKDGLVRTIDFNLKVTRVSQEFSSKVQVVQIADLNGDLINEVICTTDDGYLHILNNRLQLLLSEKLYPKSYQLTVQGKRKAYLLVSSKLPASKNLINYTFYEFSRIPLSTQLLRGERLYLLWVFVSFLVGALLFYARGLFYGSYGRRMLMSLLHQAGILDKILILRANGKVLRIGSQWQILFGLNESGQEGKPYSEVFKSTSHSNTTVFLDNILKNSKITQNIEISLENHNSKNNLKLNSFYLPILKYFFIQLTDLTEQEYLNRIKSWAPVAQRMAHGIKNPLTSVKLNAEELRHLIHNKYKLSNSELDEYFEAIISQVKKLTRISDRFMRFVQLETPELKPVDINNLVQAQISQWLPENYKEININYQLASNLPKAMVDNDQISFVLKTVFYNALESIKNKGRIQITTAIVDVFPQTGDHLGMKFIELQVRDTGCGIPAEILHKIGEPYVTNKPDGTGLGISIVKKIMQDHEGAFVIDSEEKIGTVVTLRFRIAV